MLRVPSILLACLALASCMGPGQVVPQGVLLRTDVSKVYMTSGEVCLAVAPEEGAQYWRGQLEGCSTPFEYEMWLDPEKPNIIRQGAEWLFGAGDSRSGLIAFAEMAIHVPWMERVYFYKYPRRPYPEFDRSRRAGGILGGVGLNKSIRADCFPEGVLPVAELDLPFIERLTCDGLVN